MWHQTTSESGVGLPPSWLFNVTASLLKGAYYCSLFSVFSFYMTLPCLDRVSEWHHNSQSVFAHNCWGLLTKDEGGFGQIQMIAEEDAMSQGKHLLKVFHFRVSLLVCDLLWKWWHFWKLRTANPTIKNSPSINCYMGQSFCNSCNVFYIPHRSKLSLAADLELHGWRVRRGTSACENQSECVNTKRTGQEN